MLPTLVITNSKPNQPLKDSAKTSKFSEFFKTYSVLLGRGLNNYQLFLMKNARVRVTCSVFPEGLGIIFGGLNLMGKSVLKVAIICHYY